MKIIKVGRRGQISIPHNIRHSLNLQEGDRIAFIQRGDEFFDTMRGLFAKLTDENSQDFLFPLADLEVLNKKSKNYQPIKDYVVWYANR